MRRRGIDRLNEMFAEKNLETADLYAKQRAYDSSIIYYKDILAKYPQTKVSRQGDARPGEGVQGDRLPG